jgi:hypothetical protein
LSEEADKIKELPVNIIIPWENQPVKFGLTEDGKWIYLGEKKYKLELFYKKQSVLEKISFKEKKFFIELTSLASAGNLIASLFSPSSDEGDKEVQRKLKGWFLPSELFRSVGNKVDDIFNLEIKKEMRFFEPYEKNPDENYIRLTRIS